MAVYESDAVKWLAGSDPNTITDPCSDSSFRISAMPTPSKNSDSVIDAYLARLDVDKRVALQKLRESIRKVVPKAEECLSYQIPAFRLDGKVLLGFGATAKHCALYLMSASTVANFPDELSGYDTSKGTVRFSADKPLPAALVRKLVKARVAENSR